MLRSLRCSVEKESCKAMFMLDTHTHTRTHTYYSISMYTYVLVRMQSKRSGQMFRKQIILLPPRMCVWNWNGKDHRDFCFVFIKFLQGECIHKSLETLKKKKQQKPRIRKKKCFQLFCWLEVENKWHQKTLSQ